jgi:hypothetical protein
MARALAWVHLECGFVLRIDQTSAGRGKHAVKLLSRAWLGLELLSLYEVVELLLAHELKSFSEHRRSRDRGSRLAVRA